jgi:hypothetical protein
MKIRPVGAELFHADERTDMTKLTLPFRNFANAPKNCWCHQNDAVTTVRVAMQILAHIFPALPQFFRQIQIWYPYFTSTTSFQITSNSAV